MLMSVLWFRVRSTEHDHNSASKLDYQFIILQSVQTLEGLLIC